MHAFDRRTDRQTDGRTDGQTEISSLDRVCIACSAVIAWDRLQVAQLSQRDRAAGWVSYGQKWKTVNGRQYFTDIVCLQPL